MRVKYIALHADEDGNTATFLNEERLQELLNGELMGEKLNFLSEEDIETKGADPQYWCYHNPVIDILLLKIDRVLVPRPTAIKWRI